MEIDILKKSLKSKYWKLIFNKFFKINIEELLKPKIILEYLSDLNFDLNKIYTYASNNSRTKWMQGKDPYQSNHDLQNNPDFFELKIFLENYLNENIKPIFLNKNTIGKFKIKNMWFVIMLENTSHTVHAHPKSTLSGVVYLKVQSSNSNNAIKVLIPKFNFEKYKTQEIDKNFFTKNTELIKLGKKNVVEEKIFEFKPETKDMIIFNSYMYHWVEKHNETEERISLAWDAIYTI